MRWLENRIPPPVVGLLIAALMWMVARGSAPAAVPSPTRMTLAVVLVLAGPVLAALAIVQFRKLKTTVDPVHIDRASALVTGGIFSVTRNPMYLGLALVLTGFAVWLSAGWSLLGPVAFVAFITRFQIMPEERTLRTLFGNVYGDYCRRTRRWL